MVSEYLECSAEVIWTTVMISYTLPTLNNKPQEHTPNNSCTMYKKPMVTTAVRLTTTHT